MGIKKNFIQHLPDYKIPDVSSSVLKLCPSGPWDDYKWQGKKLISSVVSFHPVCWTSGNMDFLLASSDVGNPQFSFKPKKAWPAKNFIPNTPKIVVTNLLKRFTFAGVVPDLVARIGKDKLDEKGIAIVTLLGSGSDLQTNYNALRYALPCQTVDTYIVPARLGTLPIQVGHAEEDQFIGGQVLALTNQMRFYDLIGGEVTTDHVETNGLDHDVAEIHRCYKLFDKIKWVHYINPFQTPDEPFGLPRAVNAVGTTNIPFSSISTRGDMEIFTMQEPFVVGKYRTYNPGSPEMINDFADEIKSFFEL